MLRALHVGQRVRVTRRGGTVVEGAITEVDDAHVVVQGTRHGLATQASEIASVTVVAP